MFYLLWTCAPILVSIVSFFVYVVQGNELTVSVAFTVCCCFIWLLGIDDLLTVCLSRLLYST